MSNRRIVSVAAVATSGTAYTGRANGIFSTNDQAKLKQAGVWPTAIAAPSAPTAASATAGNLQATVAFTTPSSLNGETITSYTVTSSPGGVTATGASSPITVSGLTGGTSYTFTVVANTASGASLSSSSSSSISITIITYSDEVFSTYLYTGNGSTQTINNGIDLAGSGGLVWIKTRTSTDQHTLVDTIRGSDNELCSNNATANANRLNTITGFNSNGFSLGSDPSVLVNSSGRDYVSWTFRKAAKFFDVVTYTGDGTSNRAISHSLGVTPGMVIVKNTSAVGDWPVWHRSLMQVENLYLNLIDTSASNSFWGTGPNSATSFYVSSNSGAVTNASGATYVAYLFAHDTAADGMIQCGSFTTDGSNNADVTLGYEPQFLLWKKATGVGDWRIVDTMRGFSNSPPAYLKPNTSDAELKSGTSYVAPTATGFAWRGVGSGNPIIYMAIRRPNKLPTSGTQVYNAFLSNSEHPGGTPKFLSNFVVDLFMFGPNIDSSTLTSLHPRLLPGAGLPTTSSLIDSSGTYSSSLVWGYNNGVHDGGGFYEGTPDMGWMFRRAPGFFDVVCYTGTGATAGQTHALGVKPQLMIGKRRDASEVWGVAYFEPTAGNYYISGINLNSSAGATYINTYADPLVSTTTFWPARILSSTGSPADLSGGTYVAYLFATLAGISKVGSYAGNGSSQTINCGFVTGARFILIKRSDAAGDWYIWDSVRGITAAANDPHLSLNTTAAEVTTDDSIDPANSGFIVKQNATTNINVTSATYIFLAIA